MKLFFRTQVEQSFDYVSSRFDKDLFESLKPPVMSLEVVRFDGCQTGDMVELRMGLGPFKQDWHSEITYHDFTDNRFVFHDKGVLLPPPLKFWLHKHIVLSEENSSETLIIDDIEFKSGFKLLDYLIYPFMYLLFALRKPVYKQYFAIES